MPDVVPRLPHVLPCGSLLSLCLTLVTLLCSPLLYTPLSAHDLVTVVTVHQSCI